MPIMPRPKTKARRIAYKLMGVPPNIAYKRSKKDEAINRRLLYEETSRVR